MEGMEREDEEAVDPLAQTEGSDEDEGSFALARGQLVGRFVILSQLGRGGMGTVYSAHDPEIDRSVALKLHHGRSEADTERLLREARGLGRISHPNVVTVHDVGTHDGRVWLAMEQIRGRTLDAWLEEGGGRRPWREAIAVMRAAASGLVAVHEVGLVHRDFKPANLMIGKDGWVWVMDFGVVRAEGEAAPSGTTDRSTVLHGSSTQVRTALTRTGAMVGTPAYMAPEQFLGRGVDARADQFAFCVVFWQALYGERPFAGRSLTELQFAVLHDRRRPPRSEAGVPRWLRAVIERGLASDPEARWPSMRALLDALETRRRRAVAQRVAVGMVAVTGLAAGAELHRRWADARELAERIAGCEATADELDGAWSPARRQALHDALLATDVSYAATAAEKTMPWLDRQADAWREARVEACLDADVLGRWDADMLDRSRWCLDERRMELGSLVDELMLADPVAVARATLAASNLNSVGPCRDQAALARLSPPPAADREAIGEVRVELARVTSLHRTGRYATMLEMAHRALARAEALQWRPLAATARASLGVALQETGAYAEAESTLEAAYFEAANGVAPEVAFGTANRLVGLVGGRLARHPEGLRWGRHAELALVGLAEDMGLRHASLLINLSEIHDEAGDHDEAIASSRRALSLHEDVLGPDDPLVALAMHRLAISYTRVGNYGEAVALFERALAIHERTLGPDHPEVGNVLQPLTIAYFETGRYDEALAVGQRSLAISEQAFGPDHGNVSNILGALGMIHSGTGDQRRARSYYERALEIRERSLGRDHPHVGLALNNIAGTYIRAGDYARALPFVERARSIFEHKLGPEHPDVANALTTLGVIHHRTGAHDQSIALHERALSIREKSLGPTHRDVAGSLGNLATVYYTLDDLARAKPLYERVLTIFEQSLGPSHPAVAQALTDLANVHLATDDHDQAEPLYERALSIYEAALDPGDPALTRPLDGLAEIALERGRPLDAVPLAQRVVTVREAAGVPPHELAHARFLLARALWDAPVDGGGDRPRAVLLAEQARDAYRDLGKVGAETLAEIETWLAEHDGG
jgi:tetratricopeptide (TPR) repeat protein